MEFRYDKGGDLTPPHHKAPASVLADQQWQDARSRSVSRPLVSSINKAYKGKQKAVPDSGKDRRVIFESFTALPLVHSHSLVNRTAWGGARCLSFNFVEVLLSVLGGH